MTDRDLAECIFHGILRDADWISCATPQQLAPYADDLERARDNLTRAYEKARTGKVMA